jgi:hypothetical protein
VFRQTKSLTTQLLLREVKNFGLHDLQGILFRVSEFLVISSKVFLVSLPFALSTQHSYLMLHRGVGIKQSASAVNIWHFFDEVANLMYLLWIVQKNNIVFEPYCTISLKANFKLWRLQGVTMLESM